MSNRQISFHTEVNGACSDLLIDALTTNCPATRDGFAWIINSLSRYEEEGHRLYPKIIFTEELKSLKLLLPQCECIPIGSGPVEATTYQSCLKKCAPLATGDWCIFIERTNKLISFGLIRSGGTALSELPEQIIAELQSDSIVPTIIIRQVAEGIVEAISSNGHSLNITFTGRQLMDSDRRPKLSRLYNRISAYADDDVKAKLHQLLSRVFAWTIERGHGTMAVVLDSGNYKAAPTGLGDSTWLREPLDLCSRVRAELDIGDKESSASTQAVIEAAIGMLMSDGITVFSSNGLILGFKVFVKPSKSEEKSLKSIGSGGARRRAYELLRLRLGTPLIGCLMVSQDGATEYIEVEDHKHG